MRCGSLSLLKLWFNKLVQIQTNRIYFSRHLLFGWLLNNILKINQIPLGGKWKKLALIIFNFDHRTPNFSNITRSDKAICIIVICCMF